jgi:NAD(P)-dependent dehydrogenase (short-subunit alcohol dehydrogenase family)
MKTAFVTGTSSGLGRGLAAALTTRGYSVYGCSRRGCDLAGVHDVIADFADLPAIPAALERLLAGVDRLDLVVLNAGILGQIRDMTDTTMEDIERIMAINVWANKILMDWLHQRSLEIDQVVMISSGAAVLGNRGWGGYALSKATLNMLARLYAHEFPDTHITALAPGIVDTPMMDHLCDEADAVAFPALERLRAARGTDAMPGPEKAAERLLSALPALTAMPSGSFVDIRELTDPDEYARLFGSR